MLWFGPFWCSFGSRCLRILHQGAAAEEEQSAFDSEEGEGEQEQADAHAYSGDTGNRLPPSLVRLSALTIWCSSSACDSCAACPQFVFFLFPI